jgi:hypothetical protein
MSAINLQRFISMCSSAAPGQLISKAGTRNSCKLKLGLTPGVAEQYQDRNEGLMPALHELPDKELREEAVDGGTKRQKGHHCSGSSAKASPKAFSERHAWLGAILAAIGLVGIFSLSKGGSEDVSEE